MEVSTLIWTITVAIIVGMLAFDFFFHARTPHIPTLRESAIWSGAYVGIALLFGLFVLAMWGGEFAGQYYAGYVTEKALSVDNLFVFLIILASFRVPREYQEEVLLFGIAFSLIARTALIFVGAELINRFAAVFYIFGLILLLTAGSTLKSAIQGESEDEGDSWLIRTLRKVFHTTDHYDGQKLFTIENGKRMMTPMMLVMMAIGGTDVLFALDSIPAIFGLTQETFLVFTAVAFSLLGLKQLYFLIDGLLDRLIYLSYGLAAILGLIAIKLFLHALHENNVPWINDGQPVPVVEIGTYTSLGLIIGILTITVVASLVSPRGKALSIITDTEKLAQEYVALPADAPESTRMAINAKLSRKLAKMPNVRDELKEEMIKDKHHYLSLQQQARREHISFLHEQEAEAAPVIEAEARAKEEREAEKALAAEEARVEGQDPAERTDGPDVEDTIAGEADSPLDTADSTGTAHDVRHRP